MELPPHLLCLLSHLLYFFLPVFEDNGLLFWLPDVLCQPTEVVLWSLLSVEMFFWGICEGESGLPVLFLRHLWFCLGHLIWSIEWLEKPWCCERLNTRGEGDDKEWDGWMASPTQWTGVWVNSGSWWWTGRSGMLQSMGSQRVGHNWVTELNWISHDEFQLW